MMIKSSLSFLRSRCLSTARITTTPILVEEDYEKLPKSIDWRDRGAVTPIKDQKEHNICWIHAAIAALEGIHKIKTGRLIDLSHQQVVDRFPNPKLNGGGNAALVFKYAMLVGIQSARDYEKRHNNIEKNEVVTIDAYELIPDDDERSFIRALSKGPVCVDIASNHIEFNDYDGGIYYGPFGPTIDHTLTAVGYTPEYIILKNSWGKAWGEAGYMRLARCGTPLEAGNMKMGLIRKEVLCHFPICPEKYV